MTVRVWNKPKTGLGDVGTTYVDYPDASSYHIGVSFELELRGLDGKLLTTYPPGNWHHVDQLTEAPK